MRHTLVAPLLFSVASLVGCLDDAELDDVMEEVGTATRPRPACGNSCAWQGEYRGLFWDGHDSVPQIAADVGNGKIVRDISYCLLKSAVGSNGQREIMSKKVGSSWYEQGVSTRLVLTSATPPTAPGYGSITGWHAVTLTAFGKKLDPDVQWFELRFPSEVKPQRFAGYYYYDSTGRLVPQYYTPTGFYSDLTSDYFTGTKSLPGSPPLSLSLNLDQRVNLGGNNLVGWTSTQFGTTWPSLSDNTFPVWEAGNTSIVLGQPLNSAYPSAELHASVPLVKSGVMNLELKADAQVRHYVKLWEAPDPDLPTRGDVILEMGSKTTFKIRVVGKINFGIWDHDIDETLFNWSPLAQTMPLGRARFDGRTIIGHTHPNNVSDANPAGWLSSCLVSTPAVSSEPPVSDPQQWVDGIKGNVLGNVVGCPTTAELGIGRMCDKQNRPLPTFP